MHIVIVMFAKGFGNTGMSSVSYCQALKNQGHKITAILYPHSVIEKKLNKLNIETTLIKSLGKWDLFSKANIKKHLKKTPHDVVICHGEEAISASTNITEKPIIAIVRRSSVITKNLKNFDKVFAVTKKLYKESIQSGYPKEKLHIIPDMVSLQEESPVFKSFRNPPIIGTLGRFDKIKGFDVFIYSISKLKEKGINCKAIIGGSGKEEGHLKKLLTELKIEENVDFLNDIEDKQSFFEKCDIFCLPSIQESSGLILLEAFSKAKPTIVTDCEGFLEIAEHEKNALLVPKNNSKAISEAILSLINNENRAYELSTKAYETSLKYSQENIGKLISEVLKDIGQK